MKRLRYPSPALVVAALALFVSMSGTAVAAGVAAVRTALPISSGGRWPRSWGPGLRRRKQAKPQPRRRRSCS